MLTVQLLAALAALAPAVIANVVAVRDTPPGPTEWACEIAHREGRQCTNGVGATVWSPPERCALPEDHYGKCVS